MAMKTENDLENYLVDECEDRGFLTYKFKSPANAGVPDRIVIAPHDVIFFIELKHPIRKPRPSKLQALQLTLLRDKNCSVHVIDCPDILDIVLDVMQDISNVKQRKGYIS